MNAGKISVIAVLLLLSFFVLPDCVQAKYSGGSGEPNDPYQIGTAGDLLVLAADANDYNKPFVLIADINLAGSGLFTTAVIAPDTNNSNSTFDGNTFTGVFDGNNHTISNLTIDTNGAENDYLGLFGNIGSGGQIENLGLKNVNITSGPNSICLGGLVGYNNGGTISNCYSTGKTSGGDNSDSLGGLAGKGDGGNIINCYSKGNVISGTASYSLGGLVGKNTGNISNSYSTGAVTGGDNSHYLGGLVGAKTGTISNCFSTDAVIGGSGSSHLGGLMGYNFNNIDNCYSTGAVTSTGAGFIGGLVGRNYNLANISDCYSTGDVSGDSSSNLGGLVGANDGNISNCYFLDTEPNNGLGTPLTDTQMKHQTNFSGWDFDDVWRIREGVGYPKLHISEYSGGSGTAGAPYKIGSAADLLTLAANIGDYDAYFVLTADINLASYNFTTAVIAPDTNNSASNFQGVQFSGVFDGNSHTISNLTIETGGVGNDFLGLFGFVTSGEIKNLGLEDVNITGDDNSICLGGLVGNLLGNINDNSGIISNCYSSGAVTGGDNSEYVGGLVGFNHYGTISNCYSTGAVSGGSGSSHLGGLVGYNQYGNINDCHSAGNVFGNGYCLGGLVGSNYSSIYGSISNCYSTGAVTGGDNSLRLGGLVGSNYDSISNCHSTGAVSGGDNSEYLGGLVGWNNGSISNCFSTGAVTGGNDSCYLGGLAGGNNSNGIISDCYSTGTVTGGNNSYDISGLVGVNRGNISNCYSTGTVTGTTGTYSLGGLVGFSDSDGGISNCYSTGTVTGGDNSERLGGLVGWNYNGSISNCYSTGAVTGGDNSSSLGGLLGFNGGSISNCYSTGAVTGTSVLGGLVGYNIDGSIISNCYSTGDVSGTNLLGGLVGYNNGGTISNCYSTGDVTGTSDSGGLLGYNNGGTISSCYFPVTEPNNGIGTMLTDKQMKQQKSFIGWDFIGETINGPNDVWWINKGVSFPKLSWQLDITKCTVTAGSKASSDKISFSGTMGAKADDFNDANVIEITINSNDIVSPCALTFPIDANTFKKGKYNYSKTANGVKKSFTYDVKTRKFAFSASNVELSGLGCPVTIEIEVGDYDKTAEVNEVIVNGPRVPIPILLMMGVKDVLRVDKCTVKQNNKPNKDQLTASGAFAVENPDPCMANWITEGLVITLGSQQFDIHKNSLKAGKGMFSCSNVKVTDPNATAAATFNFNLCSFILTIKDANIPTISGDVDFGAAFADFDEVD